jgi:hypothetical protein
MIGLVSRVQVFNEIDAILCHQGKHKVEGHIDMGLKMAAVVDNNVRVTEFGDHLRKECKVILTTDPDVDLAVFELLAARIDINSDDDRKWAKIVAPLLQGASFSDTDFEDRDVAIAESCEMLLVERKVLVPFMNSGSSGNRVGGFEAL